MFLFPPPTTIAISGPAAVASCDAADPAIVSVTSGTPLRDDAGADHFPISVTVRNIGAERQGSSTLDSVVFYLDRTKTDVKGLEPLEPGASQTVTFVVARSSDAGPDTTTAQFDIEFAQPIPARSQDCDTSNDDGSVTI